MTTTTFSNVSGAEQLSDDILAVDRASRADGGSGVIYSITLAPDATLTEQADIAAINLAGKDSLAIDGQGAFLNGDDSFRGFFAYSGKIAIENLTIENAVAKGGAGGEGPMAGGGGGAGLGGGLFVADNSVGGAAPANVTLDNVVFRSDSAVGGAGRGRAGSGGGGGGGGGLGGAGGAGATSGGGGGGGVGSSGQGGAGLFAQPGGRGLIRARRGGAAAACSAAPAA
jgi:hypothetical protein